MARKQENGSSGPQPAMFSRRLIESVNRAPVAPPIPGMRLISAMLRGVATLRVEKRYIPEAAAVLTVRALASHHQRLPRRNDKQRCQAERAASKRDPHHAGERCDDRAGAVLRGEDFPWGSPDARVGAGSRAARGRMDCWVSPEIPTPSAIRRGNLNRSQNWRSLVTRALTSQVVEIQSARGVHFGSIQWRG